MMSQDEYPYQAAAYLKNATRIVRAEREALRDSTQAHIDASDGPYLEVAGPSTWGFVLLDGVHFPKGLVTSNYHSNHLTYGGENVDMRADVRYLPFAAKSLGGIIVSFLSKTPGDTKSSSNEFTLGDYGRIANADYAVHRAVDNSVRGDYSLWSDSTAMQEFQRLAFLKQARRLLKPNGIVLIRGHGDSEVDAARILGFEVVASVLTHDGDYPDEDHHQRLGVKQGFYGSTEELLKLTNLNTPAGKYIESCRD